MQLNLITLGNAEAADPTTDILLSESTVKSYGTDPSALEAAVVTEDHHSTITITLTERMRALGN